MLSVLITDYLQFVVMGFGIVITSVLVVCDIGWTELVHGLSNCWNASEQGTSAAGLKMDDHPFNPVHTSWGYILWQIVFQIAAVTTWQTQVSRVLAAKDEHTAKKVYTRTAFYYVGRFGLPGLWGAAALVYFTGQGGLPEGVDSLTAMPAYLSTILPIGLIGIVIAGMLAAEMSTDSGYLLTWATVIYNDLIMPCVKKPLTAKTKLLITRSLVLLIGLFLLFYGLWYEMTGNAWDYLAVTGSIYLSSVFTLLVAGLYWQRATSTGAFAALLLGAVGPLTFLLVNMISAPPEKASMIQPWLLKLHTMFPNLEPINPAVAGASSFGLAFAGMIVGSLLTKAEQQTGDTTAS
jgi:SSS family solute:Na+ symporter